MEWVKLDTTFYLDEAIVAAGEAAEVLFVRAMAWCGDRENDGVVPRDIVPRLTPTRGKARAAALVREGLWEPVPEGWRIRSWSRKQRTKTQVEGERAAGRKRQADYKARNAVSNGVSNAKVTGESRGRVDTAAAADLDPVLGVLRSKLQEHTRLQGLRFDALRPDDAAELVALVEMHGDQRLVDVAIDTCRTPTPVHVGAFMNTWRTLPPPGQRLAAVTPRARCDTHDWITLTSGGVCTACASEAIEATGATR